MKISSFLATALGVFLFAGAASAATETYSATMTAAQSGTTSTAMGSANFNFDTESNVLTGTITYTDGTIVPTEVQVRTGACGETGANFRSATPDGVGVYTVTAGTALEPNDVTALRGGKLFVAVFNTSHPLPNSEIRGQLLNDANTAEDPLCGTATDAGTDAGKDSGPAATGGDGGTDVTPTTNPTTTDSSSGCNTTSSSSPGSNAALALGLGLALYGISRKRKQG